MSFAFTLSFIVNNLV